MVCVFYSIEHHIDNNDNDKQAGFGTPALSGSGGGAYLSYLRANNLDNLPVYCRANIERQTTIHAHTLELPKKCTPECCTIEKHTLKGL